MRSEEKVTGVKTVYYRWVDVGFHSQDNTEIEHYDHVPVYELRLEGEEG